MAYNQNYGVQPQSYQPQQYQQPQSQQNFGGSQYGGSQSSQQQPMQQQQFGGQMQSFAAPQSFGSQNQGFGGPQSFGSPQPYGGGGMQAMGGATPNTQGSGVSSLFANPNINGATFGGTPPTHQHQQQQQQSFMNGPYGGDGLYQVPQNQNKSGTQMNQHSIQSQQQQMNGGSGGVMFNGGGTSSKNWDQSSQNQFTQQMTQRMRQILGYNQFGPNVGQLTASINQASDALLQSMNKPNFKYVSHTLLIPNGQAYHMGHQLHIQPKTDVCITVKVDTMNITAILEAYCLAM